MTLKHDPEYAKALEPWQELLNSRPAPAVHDVEGRRSGLKALFSLIAQNAPAFEDVETTEHTFKSYDGAELDIRRMLKKGSSTEPGPAVLHIHGGGMIAGDIKTFATTPKAAVSLSGVQLFDVEYRLAPEMKHTSLVEDCYAALQWLHEHADEFNVDRKRIAVMGESAGGGISAGVALMARDRKLDPPLAKQILVYPMLDYKNIKPVSEDLNKFLFWTVDSNITGWTALLGDRIESGDVSQYASPTYAESLKSLPSTYIDCGTLDLFRDEDTEYVRRLAAADVDVDYHLYPGVPHAFEAFGAGITVTKKAIENRMQALRSF